MFRFAPLALLVLSALCLGVAPLFMPDSYNWIEHGVSESAAQGVKNGWIARVGFVTLGVAVLWIAAYRRQFWSPPGAFFLGGFGVSMIGVAAFSARSWEPAAPFDNAEDRLHSIFATTVGIGFVVGLFSVVAASAIQRRRSRPTQPGSRTRRSGDSPWFVSVRVDLHDLVPLAVALVVPMTGSSPVWGLLQRVMFVGAYYWFGSEARRSARPHLSG